MEQATTLTTFMLQTVPTIRSVELLGSWDNFKKRYPMEKDLRRGRGSWRGCHSFEDISYEGLSRSTTKKRAGGLRMGGTYWYFYVLDGDVDYHNPAEPSTTGCPLLPGQSVNVFDVPIELGPEQSRDRSQSATDVNTAEAAARTMNPADKFVNPRAPPAPRQPRLGSAPASLFRLFGRSTRATSLSSSGSNSPSHDSAMPSAAATLTRFLLPPRRSSLPESVPQCSSQRGRSLRSLDCIKKRAGTISRSGSRRLSTSRQTANVRKPSVEANATSPNTESGYSPGALDAEMASVQYTVQRLSEASRADPVLDCLSEQGVIPTGQDDLVPSLSMDAPGAAFDASRPSELPMAPNLFSPDQPINPPPPPLLRPQMPPRWDSFSLAVDQPVTSHFSLWSTPSIRSISSRSSSDIAEISSPGLTNSDSYTSPLSQGTPSGAVSPFHTDFFEDCLPELPLNAADLSSERFRQQPCLEDHAQNSLHSLCIRNDWIHDAPAPWQSSGFEGYRLPEHQHNSETTIRKFTSSDLPPPMLDLPSSEQSRPDSHSDLKADIPEELAYLGDIIT